MWQTPIALMLLLAFAPVGVSASADSNLIEYSYGGFAAGMESSGPMLLPPIVKIYQDGRVVFLSELGVRQGVLSPRKLARLRNDLAMDRFLRYTRLVQVKKGDSPGYHGGMAYIRYLDGKEEVILGSLLLPKRGPWARLVRKIHSYLPKTHSSFSPDSVRVTVFTRSADETTEEWPFYEAFPLAQVADQFGGHLTIDEPKAVAFLLRNIDGGFSWLNVRVREAGVGYSVHINEVSGWYEPDTTALLLGFLAYEDETRDR